MNFVSCLNKKKMIEWLMIDDWLIDWLIDCLIDTLRRQPIYT